MQLNIEQSLVLHQDSNKFNTEFPINRRKGSTVSKSSRPKKTTLSMKLKEQLISKRDQFYNDEVVVEEDQDYFKKHSNSELLDQQIISRFSSHVV